jgi:choline dehydrogenase-like flavoprotein
MAPENVALCERDRPAHIGLLGGMRVHPNAPGTRCPDIQFHFGAGASISENADPPIPHDGYIIPTLLTPTSRWQVTLRNALPHAEPRIRHNCFRTDDDTRTIIDGTRVALEIASRPALRKRTQPTGRCPIQTPTPTSCPSCVTNAPPIMIAEKAADLIRALPPLPRAAAPGAHAGLAHA